MASSTEWFGPGQMAGRLVIMILAKVQSVEEARRSDAEQSGRSEVVFLVFEMLGLGRDGEEPTCQDGEEGECGS